MFGLYMLAIYLGIAIIAAAIIDRIVHHGRLIEFTGPSRRVSQALMFGKTDNQ